MSALILFFTRIDLGQDEMGRRGCPDCSKLDLDLKARHISTEELMYILKFDLAPNNEFQQSVASESFLEYAPWWDKSCDVGLVLGTFIHGLGNYEAMRHDEELPFLNRIKYWVKECDKVDAEIYRRFEKSAHAAREVFDVALDTIKIKFQQQTTAAVAAVVASSKGDADTSKSKYVLQSQQFDEDDIITVSRLKDAAVKAFRAPCDPLSTVPVVSDRQGKGPGGRDVTVPYCPLPMPDSKHLDHLLLRIVNSIEETKLRSQHLSEPSSQVVQKLNVNGSYCPKEEFFGRALFDGCLMILDKKRPPDNESDYFNGACSYELASVAVGADSSRYERGPSVPMVITRFGLGAVLLADDAVVDIVSKTKLSDGQKKDDKAQAVANDTVDSAISEQSNASIEQNGVQNLSLIHI